MRIGKFLAGLFVGLFLVSVAGIAYAKAKEAPQASVAQAPKDDALKNAQTQKKIQEALAKKSPDEIRNFTEQIEKEKAAFQEKYLSTPIGEREKMARDFSDKVRAERQVFEKELQALPPDPKEKILRDYQEKVKVERKELADKLKLMKVGPKEEKMAEFDKNYEAQRKTLVEKMDKLPQDKREEMYKGFKQEQDKKIKAFYGI